LDRRAFSLEVSEQTRPALAFDELLTWESPQSRNNTKRNWFRGISPGRLSSSWIANMLVILRIIFTSALLYAFNQAWRFGGIDRRYDDMTGSVYLVVAIFLCVACACVWVPYLGAKLADPLTGGLAENSHIERSRFVLKLIRWAQSRNLQRLTVLLCFVEGVRYPWLPSAFVIGLKNARPGSWHEKIFAREVYRFTNIDNCVLAVQVLLRHGIQVRTHGRPEVNLALNTLDRGSRPTAAVLAIPSANPVTAPERNLRIDPNPSGNSTDSSNRDRTLFIVISSAIRRTIQSVICLLLAGMGLYVWTQRARFDPVIIWVKTWHGLDERAVNSLNSVTGQVVRIEGMDRIHLNTPGGQTWNVGATGLVQAKSRNSQARLESKIKCVEYLQSILLSNQVRVELTYTNGHNALGLIYVGETNVNAELIKYGYAKLQPQYIRFLPVNKQYPLLMAERQAQERATAIAQVPSVSK
jgi:hypothetical protein